MQPNLWYAITFLGDPIIWAYLSVVLLLMYFIIRDNASQKSRRFLKTLLIVLIPSIAFSLIFTGVMKDTFQIARPCIPCTEGAADCNEFCPTNPQYAFPSGHAATGFVAYTSFYLVWGRRRYLPVFILPVLVAASRLILGVHTLTDVVAGSVLGLVITLLFWKARNTFPWK